MRSRTISNGELSSQAEEDEGYFSEEDDQQDVPLVVGSSSFSVEGRPPPRRERKNRKNCTSFSWKSYLGVVFLMMIGGIFAASFYSRANPQHQKININKNNDAEGAAVADGTMDITPDNAEGVDAESPAKVSKQVPQSTVSLCEEEFLKGETWKSWLQTQGSLPTRGRCHNPLTPWDKTAEMNGWKRTFDRNKNLVRKSIAEKSRPLDVVFFGDSITEHWYGTDLGRPVGRYKDIVPVYETFFRHESAQLHGLALGIGGDRCTNLLYRIMAGEMPDELQPKIFWILIGTNDFGGDQCSDDAVTAGNLWIVKVLLKAKPKAQVVLNSILPRGERKLDTDRFPHIRLVNQRLECFADAHDRVHFFNATDYFTTQDGQFVNVTLMPDTLHPGRLGSEIWARGITDFALDLINNSEYESKDDPKDDPTLNDPTAISVIDSTTKGPETKCHGSIVDDQSKTWEEWIKLQGLEKDRCSEGPKQNKLTRGSCHCTDPTQPRPEPYPDWRNALARNVALVKEATAQSNERPLDVVLFGDSIVEFWQGYYRGKPLKNLQENVAVYNDLFHSDSSAVRGVGLGIAGDRSVNLLYRLQKGELSQELNAPIYWLLIGTNDWGSARCNEDMITAGVLKVVGTLRRAKPDARVVINSILPRGEDPLIFSDAWRVLQVVNTRLECYAVSRDGVSFFNATDIFLRGNGNGERVDHDMMSDYLHPSARGYRAWGNQIVNTVLKLQE